MKTASLDRNVVRGLASVSRVSDASARKVCDRPTGVNMTTGMAFGDMEEAPRFAARIPQGGKNITPFEL
jgi:hypothetical protein